MNKGVGGAKKPFRLGLGLVCIALALAWFVASLNAAVPDSAVMQGLLLMWGLLLVVSGCGVVGLKRRPPLNEILADACLAPIQAPGDERGAAMSRLPLAAQFAVGMLFLLLGAFLCVLGAIGGEPIPLIAGGGASAAIGLTLIAVGVVRRNRAAAARPQPEGGAAEAGEMTEREMFGFAGGLFLVASVIWLVAVLTSDGDLPLAIAPMFFVLGVVFLILRRKPDPTS